MPKPKPTDPMKPIHEINDMISIPRASLDDQEDDSNDEKLNSFGTKTKIAGMAFTWRTSYTENQREQNYQREANTVPKRNASYKVTKNSRQTSYENKAFDY